jgi:hypothetical protein
MRRFLVLFGIIVLFLALVRVSAVVEVRNHARR